MKNNTCSDGQLDWTPPFLRILVQSVDVLRGIENVRLSGRSGAVSGK